MREVGEGGGGGGEGGRGEGEISYATSRCMVDPRDRLTIQPSSTTRAFCSAWHLCSMAAYSVVIEGLMQPPKFSCGIYVLFFSVLIRS